MQFEDADEACELNAPLSGLDLTAPREPNSNDRPEGAYVDDEPPVDVEEIDWSEEDDGEWDRGLNEGLEEVMDQDWDAVAGDFTKRYNRMKQHVVATHSSTSSNAPALRPMNAIPAANRPRPVASAPTTLANSSHDPAGTYSSKVSDQLAHLASRYSSQLDLGPSSSTARKGGNATVLHKDKADRATVEQVLDPRTRLIIFKMMNRELISRVDGCVSTGKEANVYHAVAPDGGHLALKIYKTSILVFKDRDRYVTGEFRFKNGYARSNPRKMVRLWAEKEMRNLRRMKTAGLRVPDVLEVRENVLVMQFLGEDEWEASPRLKDATISPEDLPLLYIETLILLRLIFTQCKLVHADFSEYNILYHQGHLWVIDVSQSVEHDHPAAFDFLRKDIQNAEDFFAKRGVETLGLRRAFEFVTKAGTVDENQKDMRVEVERLLAVPYDSISDDEGQEGEAPQEREGRRAQDTEDAVFAKSYIPRALDEVYDPERDVARVLRGEGEGLIYANITGVAEVHKQGLSEGEGSGSEESEGSEGEDDDDDDDDDEEGERSSRPRGKKHEDKEEKKKRKQEVKEAARVKRTQKMSKSEKARRVKKSSGKR